MTPPLRIQLKRTKGWRMPPNTVKVDRTTRFGNYFRVGLVNCSCRSAGECSHNTFNCETAAEAVERYRATPRSARRLEQIRRELHGKNLACWCRLCDRHKDGKPAGEDCAYCAPCHADVLLDLANPVRLSDRERQVMIGMADTSDDFGFCSFRNIAVRSGLDIRHVRRTVRALARKRLLQYGCGLWSEDGEPGGAGYGLTEAGRRWCDANVPVATRRWPT